MVDIWKKLESLVDSSFFINVTISLLEYSTFDHITDFHLSISKELHSNERRNMTEAINRRSNKTHHP